MTVAATGSVAKATARLSRLSLGLLVLVIVMSLGITVGEAWIAPEVIRNTLANRLLGFDFALNPI